MASSCVYLLLEWDWKEGKSVWVCVCVLFDASESCYYSTTAVPYTAIWWVSSPIQSFRARRPSSFVHTQHQAPNRRRIKEEDAKAAKRNGTFERSSANLLSQCKYTARWKTDKCIMKTADNAGKKITNSRFLRRESYTIQPALLVPNMQSFAYIVVLPIEDRFVRQRKIPRNCPNKCVISYCTSIAIWRNWSMQHLVHFSSFN